MQLQGGLDNESQRQVATAGARHARLGSRVGGSFLAAEANGSSPLVIDFDGIDGISPSIVDELLTMIAEMRAPGAQSIVFANVPTRLSSKYSVLVKAHSKQIEIDATGERESWILTPATPAAAPTR